MRTLDDYAADLPTTRPPRDTVPDSSSDCSDIDEPKEISKPALPSTSAASSSRTPGRSGLGFQLKPHSIVKSLPSSSGEKTSSPEDQYYAVQW